MTGVPPKLRREWAERLKAAGFEDLESGRDPDGPLSDRGNLHPVDHTPSELERLADRMEDGADYQSWARHVLHTTHWRNAAERRIWELHCDGLGDRDIAATLTIKRHRVQAVLSAIKAKAAKRWTSERARAAWRPSWQRRAREGYGRRAARLLSTEELTRLLRAPSSTE